MEYKERDIDELGGHYTKHVVAMTMEELHSKAAIAAELAFRDNQIEELTAKLGGSKSHDSPGVKVEFNGQEMTMGDPFLPDQFSEMGDFTKGAFDHAMTMRQMRAAAVKAKSEMFEFKHGPGHSSPQHGSQRDFYEGNFDMQDMGDAAKSASFHMQQMGRAMRIPSDDRDTRGIPGRKLIILDSSRNTLARFDCDRVERNQMKRSYRVEASGILERPGQPSMIKFIENGRTLGTFDRISDEVIDHFQNSRQGAKIGMRVEIDESPSDHYRHESDMSPFTGWPEIPKKTGRSELTQGPGAKSRGKGKNSRRYG
ncbi:MAG: hypothetical protein KUG81_04130 [Gammaproteobacteria bacterium]|nr:hypothetical protein [Gammaproteobacteria bacterium]